MRKIQKQKAASKLNGSRSRLHTAVATPKIQLQPPSETVSHHNSRLRSRLSSVATASGGSDLHRLEPVPTVSGAIAATGGDEIVVAGTEVVEDDRLSTTPNERLSTPSGSDTTVPPHEQRTSEEASATCFGKSLTCHRKLKFWKPGGAKYMR